MRRVVRVVVVSVIGALSGAVAVAPQAGASPSSGSPQSIRCVAPETGAKGATGLQGDTGVAGPKGDTGFSGPNGPARSAHLRGSDAVPCAVIPVLCLGAVFVGEVGMQGPTGATGPKGDTGPFAAGGPARSAHVRGFKTCEGFPRECTYAVQGRPGDTGLTGETGVKGATGEPEPALENGPARQVHRGLGGVAGSEITLPNCDLPLTGGSTPLLPYALLLVALGGVVLLLVQRRRRTVA